MIRRTRKRTDRPAEEVGVRLGEGLHLLLAVQGRARGRRHGRDERRGAREREGGDDLLHRSGSAEGKGGLFSRSLILALATACVLSQRSRSVRAGSGR